MYPPPQSQRVPAYLAFPSGAALSSKQKEDNNSHNSHWIFRSYAKPPHHHSQHHRHHHSQTTPFAYEYVLQDGHLPVLAETTPLKKTLSTRLPPSPPLDSQEKQLTQLRRAPTAPQQPQQASALQSSDMFRRKSLRRKEKQVHFDGPDLPPSPPSASKTDKLRRALSLTGMRSSSSSRNVTPQRSPRLLSEPMMPQQVIPDSPPERISSRRMGPSFLIPPTPRVQVPTPEASPEPTRSSFASSMQSGHSHIPHHIRTSWISQDEEQRDLHLMHYMAMGRLTPSPVPSFGGHREKAFATLGITDMPMTPPYTPAGSTAPSVHEVPIRRGSAETRFSSQRQSMAESHRHSAIEEPQLEKVERLASPRTSPNDSPRLQQLPKQPSPDEIRPVDAASPETIRPFLRRKTSKFTEHLDPHTEVPKPLMQAPVHASLPPVPIINLPKTRSERTASSANQLPRPLMAMQLPKRSESMRTPSPNPDQWEVVVQMARARPVVAAGTAKLISC
jgi:hypothetical protein